jgi:hypothetical protein
VKNTADVIGGKPIAVLLQSISGVSAINPLVAFYDIHGGKRGAILLFCPGHHTRLMESMFKHAHKCLDCAGIEPATSCTVGEYSDRCANRSSTLYIFVRSNL